jgi:polyadenylate-binding protein
MDDSSMGEPAPQAAPSGETLLSYLLRLKCSLSTTPNIPIIRFDLPPTINRLSDENALRAKVQEALSVYDEYLKNKGDPDESTKQGGNADGEAEKNE